MNKKGIRIGMVTAVVAVTFAMFTHCFSSHENDNGTSMMVETSGNAIETATEKELDEIMNRCSQVLENRLRSFCEEEPGLDKAKFSIKRVNDNKSIRIDFKNLELSQDQVTRVLKLLQSHGCIQFYETYRFNEICDCFFKANEKLAEKNDPSDIEDNVVVLFKGPLFRLLQPNFEQVAPGKFSAELNARAGTAQANALVDYYKTADDTTDDNFLRKLGDGMEYAFTRKFANTKEAKAEHRNYKKAFSLVYEYKDADSRWAFNSRFLGFAMFDNIFYYKFA